MGTRLGSNVVDYSFTEDTNTPERTYIPVNHLSLESFSSQVSSDKAENIISGNDNNGWHTGTEPTEGARTVVIKLDSVKYISALEYMSTYNNGKLKKAAIYTSLDGKEWVKSGEYGTYNNDGTVKKIELTESLPARYVKIVGVETYGSTANTIFTCKSLNLFEDTTKEYKAEPTIEYSEVNPTKDNVIATLNLPSGCEAVDGITEYEFTENGTYTFKFLDANGVEQSIEASVSNIDREAPVGVVSYNITELTNGSVVATLECDEDVTIISEGVVDNTYTFEDNAIYTFEFMDEAGNIGTVEAKVDWIYKNKPVEMVTYSASKDENDKPLVVDLNVNLDEVEILNEDGASSVTFTKNGEHIFKLRLKDTGYEFEVKVVVDWLDEEAIEESLKEENNDSVGGGDTDEDTDEDTTVGDEDTDEDTTIGDEDTDEDTTIGDEDTTVGDEDTTIGDEDATVGDEDTTDEDTTGGGDSGNDGSAEDTTVGSESTNNGGTTDIEEDNDTDADKPLNDTNNGNNDNSSGNSQSSGNNGNVNNNSNNDSGNNSNNGNVNNNSNNGSGNNSNITGNSEVSNNSDSSSNTVVNNSSSDIKVDISTDNEVSNNKVTTEPTESTDNTIVINSSDDNIEVNKSEQLDGALDTDNSYGENNFFIVISSVGGSLLGILAWLRKRFL